MRTSTLPRPRTAAMLAVAGVLLCLAVLESRAGRYPLASEGYVVDYGPWSWPSWENGKLASFVYARERIDESALAYLPTHVKSLAYPDGKAMLTCVATYLACTHPITGSNTWVRHGPVTYRHETNWVVACTLHWSHGELQDRYIDIFYDNGQLCAHLPAHYTHFYLGRSYWPLSYTGEARIYARDGSPIRLENWVGGYLHGTRLWYWWPVNYQDAGLVHYPGQNGVHIEQTWDMGVKRYETFYHLNGRVQTHGPCHSGAANNNGTRCGIWSNYNEYGVFTGIDDWGEPYSVPGNATDPPIPQDESEVRGWVTDAGSNTVISGVTVTVTLPGGGVLTTNTNGGGFYRIPLPPPPPAPPAYNEEGGIHFEERGFIDEYYAVAGVNRQQTRNVAMTRHPGAATRPLIKRVSRKLGVDDSSADVYIQGEAATQYWLVDVDWRGKQPDKFDIWYNTNLVEQGRPPNKPDGLLQVGVLVGDSRFHPEDGTREPNAVRFFAHNKDGETSARYDLHPKIVARPAWTRDFNGPTVSRVGGNIHYDFATIFPDPLITVDLYPALLPTPDRERWNSVPYFRNRPFVLALGMAIKAALHSDGITVVGSPADDGSHELRVPAAVSFSWEEGTWVDKLTSSAVGLSRRKSWDWTPLRLDYRFGTGAGGSFKESGDTLFPQLKAFSKDLVLGDVSRYVLGLPESDLNARAEVRTLFAPEIVASSAGGLALGSSTGTVVLGVEFTGYTGLESWNISMHAAGQCAIDVQFPAKNGSYTRDWTLDFQSTVTLDKGTLAKRTFTTNWYLRKPPASGNCPPPSLPRTYAGMGDAAPRTSLDTPVVPGTWERLIANNVLSGADPAVARTHQADLGRHKLVVYVCRDPADPEGQDTEIAWTLWGVGDWNEGVILDDTRAEAAPTLVADSNGLFVCAWERVKDENLQTTNVVDVLGELEIVYATLDTSTKTWSTPVALTDNAHMDVSPRLLQAPNKDLVLCWQSNADNKIFGDAPSPHRVHYAEWDAAARQFGPVETVPRDFADCMQFRMSHDATNAVLTYTRDMDGDVGTHDDTEVFTLERDDAAWGAPQRVTTNSTPDRNPHVACLENGFYELVWLRDDEIVHRDAYDGDFEVVRTNCTGFAEANFSFCGGVFGEMLLTWSDLRNGKEDIYYYCYDVGEWSTERRLFADVQPERRFHAAFNYFGGLEFAYIRPNATTGSNDLMYARKDVETAFSLVTADVWVEPTNAVAGDFVTLHATVRNIGDNPYCGSLEPPIEVEFYQGSPEFHGGVYNVPVYIGTATIDLSATDGVIRAGHSIDATVPWQLPTQWVETVYDLMIYANLADESPEGDGVYIYDPPDIEAVDLRYEGSGAGFGVAVGEVRNNGPVVLSNIAVRVDLDGAPFPMKWVSLATGETADVSFPMPSGTVYDATVLLTMLVDADDDFHERNETNNVAYAVAAKGPIWTPNPDSDNDGLLDSWETNHFHTLDRDGTGDFDGDGLSDADESEAGTDPTDPGSGLVGHVERTDAEGNVEISWQGVTGRVYQVQFRESLNEGAWNNIDAGHYAMSNGIINVEHDSGTAHAFYRVLLYPSFDPP